jgi:hypothetical protein
MDEGASKLFAVSKSVTYRQLRSTTQTPIEKDCCVRPIVNARHLLTSMQTFREAKEERKKKLEAVEARRRENYKRYVQKLRYSAPVET